MNTTITVTVDLAELIPVLTALAVFVSVIMAGSTRSLRFRRVGWMLGLGTQALLVLFGVLTGVWSFALHALPASAFLFNLWRDMRGRTPKVKKLTHPIAVRQEQVPENVGAN